MTLASIEPTVSVVVLCYNGLKDLTKPCIESLIQCTKVNYEIIIVDNASTDGTAQYLRELEAKSQNICIQLNSENRGYAGGNNDGIKLARGEIVILLNNDTLLTPGWLDKLRDFIVSHPTVGLVGPVTNSAGNEQRIDLIGLNENNYRKVSQCYTSRHVGDWHKTEKLGFFCVAIRRSVIAKIGLLDENFGIGMFEDDDYCIRAKHAGFDLAVIEDSFVYHKGSVSFGKLSSELYNNILLENRAYFQAKHNIVWTMSDIALSYYNLFRQVLEKDSHVTMESVELLKARLDGFASLLGHINRQEALAINAGGNTVRESSAMVRERWRKYWLNIRNKFLFASFAERKRFIVKALRYVFKTSNRVAGAVVFSTPAANDNELIIKALGEITDEANGRKVVIFPATVDFSFMEQRPQQLARAFVKHNYLVVYGTLNFQSDKVNICEKVQDGLYLVNENYFSLLSHVIRPEKTIYYCMWPNNVKHVNYLPFNKIIYDIMDDISLLNLPLDNLLSDHAKIMSLANLITVSATNLLNCVPHLYNNKTIVVRNAVSSDFISRLEECNEVPFELKTIRTGRIIGYFGALAEWCDYDLLDRIAREFPSDNIVLIGPTFGPGDQHIKSLLDSRSNVHYLGMKAHCDLVNFLPFFDVCLIPFIKNQVTDSVSPVKLFEYLAADKPVVSTNIKECSEYSCVEIASDHDEFVNKLRLLLDSKSAPVNYYKQFALENTWEKRVETIVKNIVSST